MKNHNLVFSQLRYSNLISVTPGMNLTHMVWSLLLCWAIPWVTSTMPMRTNNTFEFVTAPFSVSNNDAFGDFEKEKFQQNVLAAVLCFYSV